MKMRLTDKGVRGLKPKAARYDVWDSSFTGGAFGVRVAPSGLKTFVAMARDGSGRKRRMALGSWPETGLAEARAEARAKLADLSRGIDRDAEGATFAELAADFLRKRPKKKKLAERTVREYRRILDADLLPEWGALACASLTRADVGALLDRIAFERESPVMANRVLALASVMFNHGIDAGRFGLESNPCARASKPAKEDPRARILSDSEIRLLWAEAGRRASGDLYKLVLLTGQRPGEVKAMRRSQIAEGVWTIPSELSKNGKPHRVPLSAQALELLAGRPRLGDCVFPSRAGGGPLRWFGKTNKRVQDALGIDFRPHDLRRTCATRMARLGIDDATIARVLNHSWALNVTRRVYVVDDRLDEKRAALQSWGEELERILLAKPEAKTA